ncbi:hypothetical protein CsSME_00011598 [Camellia sinensis var. sinensis]
MLEVVSMASIEIGMRNTHGRWFGHMHCGQANAQAQREDDKECGTENMTLQIGEDKSI